MNGDVNGATTAVQNHDNRVFDHLLTHLGLSILSALDTRTFRLETQKQILTRLIVNDTSFFRGLSHKVLVFFTPERWHGQDPPDLGLDDFSDLFRQLFQCFVSYELK